MRRIVLFCALGLLGGCRTAEPLTNEVITLFCSTSEQSKTAALSAGDAVGLFAAVEGTEDYFMENVKWVVGSDGHTLTTTPAAYYPQERQAIRFYAYLPLGGTWSGARGSFSVPTDQSTAAALKQADLCWATAGSTPVATPVSLEFEHVLARLVVQANQTPTQLTVPNAVTGGVLHVTTGALVLGTTRSELNTTGSELILPAQPLTRLLLTVSGIVYVYEGAIPLETGKTTTLNLTLNPSTKTATLAGSSVTPWLATTATGNPTQAVANTLTLHWPNYVQQGAAPDKVTLTIKDATTNTTADYTIASGIVYADKAFTVPFASAALRYPYTITKLIFYRSPSEALPQCSNFLGQTIYKSGASTVGVKDVPNALLINGLWWATGNLVATNATAGKAGVGDCRIGAPADGGLYFQFGSLIGWKGGSAASGGTGVGVPPNSWTYSWGNIASIASWANDAMVWPVELVGNPGTWPATFTPGTNKWFFSNSSVTSGEFNTTDPTVGVGDPCRYYLGTPWRMPTKTEMVELYESGTSGTRFLTLNGAWGIYVGPGAAAQDLSRALFITGYCSRYRLDGYFHTYNGTQVCMTSSTVANGSACYQAVLNNAAPFILENVSHRNYGMTTRCVTPM